MLAHRQGRGVRLLPDPACCQSHRQPLPPPLRPQGAHLLQRQLPEQRQRAGEQPDEEGRWRAHDVDHGGRQHGDVGVLPGEGVDGRHHRVAARGQGAAAGREGGRAGSGGRAASITAPERFARQAPRTPHPQKAPKRRKPPSSWVLLLLVKRPCIGTHVLSAKRECLAVGRGGGRQHPLVFRCSRPLQMAPLCKSRIHALLAQNSKHRKLTRDSVFKIDSLKAG